MDALTRPKGTTGELVAAKLRRAAVESGIGPEDPLQPLISALADAAAVVPDAVAKIEAAVERAGVDGGVDPRKSGDVAYLV
jgi:hypothetical protein